MVKASPMTPLVKLVEEALAATKKKHWDPRKCKLTYNKTSLDLDLVFRFANIPSGSRIDVEYTGPRGGPDYFKHAHDLPGAVSGPGIGEPMPPTALPPRSIEAAAPAPSPSVAAPPPSPAPAPVPFSGPPRTLGAPPAPVLSAASAPAPAPTPAPGPAPQPILQQRPRPGATPAAPAAPPPAPLPPIDQREVVLFAREQLMRAMAATSGTYAAFALRYRFQTSVSMQIQRPQDEQQKCTYMPSQASLGLASHPSMFFTHLFLSIYYII